MIAVSIRLPRCGPGLSNRAFPALTTACAIGASVTRAATGTITNNGAQKIPRAASPQRAIAIKNHSGISAKAANRPGAGA